MRSIVLKWITINLQWRLLWAGRMRYKFASELQGWEVEWGPPIIWKPRWGVYVDTIDTIQYGVFRVGFLWWVLTLIQKHEDNDNG